MPLTFFKSKIGEVPNIRSITCFLLYHTLGQITFFVYIIIWIWLPPLLPIHSLRYMKWRNFKKSLKKNLKVHVMSVKKMKNVICFVIYFLKLSFFIPKLGFSKEELTWLQSLRGVPHVIQTQLSPVLLYLTDLDQFLHHWDVTEVIVHLKRNSWLLKFC